jgi:hypothetical protein
MPEAKNYVDVPKNAKTRRAQRARVAEQQRVATAARRQKRIERTIARGEAKSEEHRVGALAHWVREQARAGLVEVATLREEMIHGPQ